jgi:hypothetical protein
MATISAASLNGGVGTLRTFSDPFEVPAKENQTQHRLGFLSLLSGHSPKT